MARAVSPGSPETLTPDQLDIDACAASRLAYWDTLPARREPTQHGYRRWAVGKPHPAANRFAQHCGFTAVKERARELRKQ